MAAAVDRLSLERWRSLDASVVLCAVADHAKRDLSFRPIKDPKTTRWYGCLRGHHFELLLTGPKFWDTRAQQGGGGAIDLVIHLARVEFRQAIELLRTARL